MPEEPGALRAEEKNGPDEDGGVAQARLRVPPWAPEVAFRDQPPAESADPQPPSDKRVAWSWPHGTDTDDSRAGARSFRVGRFGEFRSIGVMVLGACLFATAGGLAVLAVVGHAPSPNPTAAGYVPGADGLNQPQGALAATSAAASTHYSTSEPTPGVTRTATALSAAGSAASAHPSVAPSPRNSVSAAVSSAAAKGVAPPATVAASTVAAVAETGTFTGYDGLCLDDWAARTVDGNQIIIYGCNGTSAQVWTVQPNGTLQVEGGCMDVSGGSVEFSTCDGAATQVWRSGPGRTLVNASLKQCLTDPDSDAGPGTGLDVAACTDGANQQWIFAGD